MRMIVGLIFFAHGVAHLVGFVMPWRLMAPPDGGYKTTLLAGRIDAGANGIRVVGVLWLLAAMAFVASGVGLVTLQPWWRTLTLAAALFSLTLSVLGWPDSRIGVWVNLAILGFLFFAPRLSWQ
jgi:hypothetical protein